MRGGKEVYLLIGLLLGMSITLGLMAVIQDKGVGRYAVATTPRDAIVIDTESGHIWGRSGKYFVDFGTVHSPIYAEKTFDTDLEQ
jgi:hypothetical protein